MAEMTAENGTGAGDQLAGCREGSSEYDRDVRELVEMLSNLNPSAEEFVPSCYSPAAAGGSGSTLSPDAPFFYYHHPNSNPNQIGNGGWKDSSVDGSSKSQPQHRRRKNGSNQFSRRGNGRLTKAQKEECIRRTIYVSDVDRSVTEDKLAELFSTHCGPVFDCRVCGDPNSVLRFAFVEFYFEQSARAALSLNNTTFGYYPLKVLPSKTAIMPVNESFLPKSTAEQEMCTRTIYCTNIDKKVTQKDIKEYFESQCGEVRRLRLLGDNVHTTRIAFIEFSEANGANKALNCSGLSLGSIPIRVSPSKTPVRPRTTGSVAP